MGIDQPYVQLNDGRAIPQLGFGLYKVANMDAPSAIADALAAGYRSLDTASFYGNERGVGEAIRAASVARPELYVTTKLWNDGHGFDATLKAFDDSLRRLQLDHVELYLIHWPQPEVGKYVDSWKALVRLREEGRAKSIGVSNFNAGHIERLIGETGVVPALNQIELHPRFQQHGLRAFNDSQGIVTEAWSPLGQGGLIGDRVIGEIAARLDKTPAQIILRWHLDNGSVVIPKSTNPERIRSNFDVFGFHLDDEAKAKIATLDARGGRIGPDPETFNSPVPPG